MRETIPKYPTTLRMKSTFQIYPKQNKNTKSHMQAPALTPDQICFSKERTKIES